MNLSLSSIVNIKKTTIFFVSSIIVIAIQTAYIINPVTITIRTHVILIMNKNNKKYINQ